MTTNPELLIARRAAKADPRAWDEIIARYGDRIYGLALRFTGHGGEAEELTQDIFLKLYRNLGRYRGDVPLMAWALRLSRNACIDHYRQHRRRNQAESLPEDVLEQIAGDDDPLRHRQLRERRELVHQTLAQMPEDQATTVMLRDLQGLSYEEVASFLEVPVGTVKSRLNRARRELVSRLERRLVGRDGPNGDPIDNGPPEEDVPPWRSQNA